MSEERHDDALEVLARACRRRVGWTRPGAAGASRSASRQSRSRSVWRRCHSAGSLRRPAGTPGLGFGQAIVPPRRSPPLPSASTSSRRPALLVAPPRCLAAAGKRRVSPARRRSILVERRGHDRAVVAWNRRRSATLLRSFPNASQRARPRLAAVSPDATSLLRRPRRSTRAVKKARTRAPAITGSGHIAMDWSGHHDPAGHRRVERLPERRRCVGGSG